MKTQYRRDLNHTYLTLKINEDYNEDYQMKMLRVNNIEGLLSVAGHGINNSSRYAYDISGKSSLKSIYEKAYMSKEDLENFLNELLTLIQKVELYMLDINKIILDPEYIFYEKGKFYFCYLPKKSEELENSFHKLTEYFVTRIDHKDLKGVQTAYILHKVTMEENYNLERIIQEIKSKQVLEEQDECEEDDWIEYPQENIKQDDIIKETPVSWKKFKNKKRNKKEKWGIWE